MHRAEAVADEHAVLSFSQFDETLKDFVLGADIESGGKRRACGPGFGQRFPLAHCHLSLVSLGQPEMQPRRYTAEEYFALEEKGEIRHEFFEGEVFAMAGESIAHNIIAQNFVLALRPALRGKNYQVMMETVQLAVGANRHYTYPDIVVSCDPQDRQESRRLHQPVLIVEVLSPSTEAYDRGLKFNQYKKLPSLRHHLLVSKKTWLVEWYQLSEHGV